MDKQKTILYISLAIVSYLLFTSWQKDYGVNAPQKDVTTHTSQQVTSDNGTVPTMANTDEDIPIATTDVAETANTEAVTVTETINNSADLITVSTPIASIQIDKKGGDIVFLSLSKFSVNKDSTDPFVLIEKNAQRLQIPQSGLIGENGIDALIKGRPIYHSANNYFELKPGDKKLSIDLSFSHNNVNYIKRYTFQEDNYTIDIEYIIDNQSNTAWTGAFYNQFKRDHAKDKEAGKGFIPLPIFLGAAYGTSPNTFEKLDYKKFTKKPINHTVEGGWIAMVQHYFVNAWVPDNHAQNTYSSKISSDSRYYLVNAVGPSQTIKPKTSGIFHSQLFLGPKIQSQLKTLSPGLERTVDYKFLWFIAVPLHKILSFLHGFVHNWGIAIILLTFLIRLALYPLSAKAYRSMANMRKFTPKMQQIRDKYKNDKQKQSVKMMELYKKEKINPLGGCLPMLLQMPIFYALYSTLLESVELRQASFLWMHDLSLMDPIFLLPLLMGASMFFQMRLNPRMGTDPMQEKVMQFMPLIFTVFFLWFPAGLVLYWLTNNILSMAQQWYINKKIGA